MFQKLKVFLLRKYYRFINFWAWKGHTIETPYSTLQASTPAGPLTLRMYSAEAGADKPLIVYFHGGGWVIGDLNTHHPFCQRLSEKTGCTVVSVDYRLAPEHPYPAAQDDCLAATEWISEHSKELGPSNGQLVLAGDSAGGHLAITTCLEISNAVRAQIVGKIAIYPATDHYSTPRASYVEKARAGRLTSKMMYWFWDTYLGGKENLPDRAFPLRSGDLATLPATLLITAENDPLLDEGAAYGDELGAAGVSLQYRHFADAEHGFACGQGPHEDFEAFMDEIERWMEGRRHEPAG